MNPTERGISCTQPGCNGEIGWDYSCHTWPTTRSDGSKGWMACMPCDSATEYQCSKCDWSYTDGLNQQNPRAAQNETKRPPWLKDHKGWDTYGTRPHPAVRHITDVWDDEE